MRELVEDSLAPGQKPLAMKLILFAVKRSDLTEPASVLDSNMGATPKIHEPLGLCVVVGRPTMIMSPLEVGLWDHHDNITELASCGVFHEPVEVKKAG